MNLSSSRNIIFVLVTIFVGLLALEIAIRTYDAFRGFSFFSERRNLLINKM